MKRYFLILISTVLFVAPVIKVFGQQPAWLFSKQNNYVESHVRYKKLLLASDNHVIVTGSGILESSTTYDSDFVIRKKDLNGVVVWEKQYGGSGEEKLVSTVATEGGYYLAGTSNSDKSRDINEDRIGDEDVWILKVNLEGELLWEKRLGSVYNDRIGNIIALPSGGVLIAGGKGVPSQGNNATTDFWTVNLDEDGVIIWDKSFIGRDTDTFLAQYFQDIVVDTNEGFIGVGYDEVVTSRTDGISIAGRPSLIKISISGDKQSVQNFEYSSNAPYQPMSGFDHIKRLSNGDLLVFGSESGNTTLHDMVFRRYNSSGTLLLSRKTFNGNKTDYLHDIIETSEGGYLAIGSSKSTTGQPITDINKGDADGIVVKLNSQFDAEWSRLIGGVNSDDFNSIIKLNNDNYIIAGSAFDSTLPNAITTLVNSNPNSSYYGPFASLYWISNQTSATPPIQVASFTADDVNACGAKLTWTTDPGMYGYVVELDGKIVYSGKDGSVKLDLVESKTYEAFVQSFDYSLVYSEKKNVVFETLANVQDRLGYNRLIGSIADDYAYNGKATDNGNFILAGYTSYRSEYGVKNDIESSSAGYLDGLAIAFDAQGKKLWDKTFGGSDLEVFNAVLVLEDGYLFGGQTYSGTIAGVTEAQRGGSDFFLVRTDKQGAVRWMHRYGGERNESISHMAAAVDGGFFLAGTTTSPIGHDLTQERFSQNQSETDVWILKVDQNGVKEWDRRLGGTSSEYVGDLVYYPTGELRVFCNTSSSNTGNIPLTSTGYQDVWAVLLASNGELQISHRWGSSGSNTFVTKVFERANGNRIIVGTTNATPSPAGFFKAAAYGSLDYYILELDFMNQHVKDFRFGGSQSETLLDAVMTPDGGYLLTGTSNSGISGLKSEVIRGSGDVWMIRVNGAGEVLWEKTYGGSDYEMLRTIIPAASGQYWLAGYAAPPLTCDMPKGKGGNDIWLIKQFDEAVTSAPSAVTGLTASFVRNPDKALVDWDAPMLDQRINHFKIYRDGELVKTTQNDSTYFTGTFEPELYSFEVSAVNFTRLESEKSSVILDLSIILSSETSADKRKELEAYPVPFTKQLTIRARSGSLQGNKIEIISLRGEIMQSLSVNHEEGGYEYYLVNGDELTNGLYLYKVQTTQGVLSGKIIKH